MARMACGLASPQLALSLGGSGALQVQVQVQVQVLWSLLLLGGVLLFLQVGRQASREKPGENLVKRSRSGPPARTVRPCGCPIRGGRGGGCPRPPGPGQPGAEGGKARARRSWWAGTASPSRQRSTRWPVLRQERKVAERRGHHSGNDGGRRGPGGPVPPAQ
jgi:hypothetical protein